MSGWTVHSLGMALALVLGALAAALVGADLWPGRRGSGARALTPKGSGRNTGRPGKGPRRDDGPGPGLSPGPGPGSEARSSPGPGVDAGTGAVAGARSRTSGGGLAREWGPAVAAGAGVAVLLGGWLGLPAGAGAAVGARKWLARQREAARSAGDAERPDPAGLPLCADLMAACLAAGAPPGAAAEAVGRCLGGPWGAALIRTGAELRLGAEPGECWERFGRLPGAREMGRCLARASLTGSAPAAQMSRLAADYRAAQTRSALARARKAGVLATAPLGVCFLPAFLLVGVAPVVMGLAGAVMGGRLG